MGFSPVNPYETDKFLNEYLLFHYGAADEVLPFANGPHDALDYAVRCVSQCVDATKLAPDARGLDVGCAVGRSTFELARLCKEVIGIDYSQRFIDAVRALAGSGSLPYLRADEGALNMKLMAHLPYGIAPERVRFEHGDAHALRDGLGVFDVVLAANLVDRLAQPSRFLAQLPRLVKPGGQLIITTPCTWLPEYTSPDHWLGGFVADGKPRSTLDGLRAALAPHFSLSSTRDLPFLIREHARKYQWSMALATTWQRQ